MHVVGGTCENSEHCGPSRDVPRGTSRGSCCRAVPRPASDPPTPDAAANIDGARDRGVVIDLLRPRLLDALARRVTAGGSRTKARGTGTAPVTLPAVGAIGRRWDHTSRHSHASCLSSRQEEATPGATDQGRSAASTTHTAASRRGGRDRHCHGCPRKPVSRAIASLDPLRTELAVDRRSCILTRVSIETSLAPQVFHVEHRDSTDRAVPLEEQTRDRQGSPRTPMGSQTLMVAGVRPCAAWRTTPACCPRLAESAG